jgi:molybdopterin molybdotransferase
VTTRADPSVARAEPSLLSVEAAREAILAEVVPVGSERVTVPAALGRITAELVSARVSLPPWANSAMDGYAVRAADTTAATERAPVELRVVGDIPAGAAPRVALSPGTAARIATGARLPDGADSVVPVELTTPLDASGRPGPRGRDASGPLPAGCLVHQAVPVGGSVRAPGSDLEAGAPLFQPGSALTAAGVGLAAGAGLVDLRVHRRPRVGVLATGDEIRAPGQPLGAAGIPDANGPGLRAQVTSAGAEAIDLGIASDELADVLKRLRGGIEVDADVLIISGGVSVGPYDVVKTAMETIGRVDLWRVAIQPGKPFAFGVAPRPDGGAPILVFGLPGNPVSSAVTFELFVRPAIRRLAGRRDLFRPADRAVLREPATKSHGRRAYLRVVADRAHDGAPLRDDQGRVRVRLAGVQGSHVLSGLAAADALAIIPESVDSLPAGAEVALWWLDSA